MAEQTAKEEAAPAEAPAPAKKNRMIMIGLIVGGVVLGGGTGAFVVAPRLSPKAAAEPAEGKAEKPAGKAVEAGKIVRLDNMIVNPAGSQGSRFLMVSVAYEVSNAEAEKLLHDREVQLRDEAMGVLAQEPLDSLVLATSRDRVKEKLAAIVRPMLPKDAPLQVYLPQFVIQ